MKFVFSVSVNGENGLGDEGADGEFPPPQNFWARTAEPPLESSADFVTVTTTESLRISTL